MQKAINKVFDKLNKLPVWVGYVCVIVASVVATVPSAVTLDVYLNEYAKELSSVIGVDFSFLVTDWHKAGYALLGGVISWGIFELIASLVFGWLARMRFFLKDKPAFMKTARYCYAVYELIIGLASLPSIWYAEAYSYYINVLVFIMITTSFTFGYLYIKDRCLNPKYISNAYNSLFMLHFIYYGALSVINIVYDLVDTETAVEYIISDAALLVAVIAGCLILYFTVYKPLQEEQRENRKRIVTRIDNDNNGPDEIFRGYGM